MSRTKKLTFNMFAAKQVVMEPAEITVEWMSDTPITVKRTLSIDEAMSFVNQVVASVFDEESGEYMPELFMFALKVNVLVCYAGFEMPKDLKKAYRLVTESDLVERVCSAINRKQYDEMLDAIGEKIDFRKEASISTAAHKIDELVHKMDDVMNDGSALVDEMQSPEFIDMMSRLDALKDLNEGPAQHSSAAAEVTAEYSAPSKIVVLPGGN